MADEKRNPNSPEQPPKIRVTGEKKSDTARIDLSKATPPPSVPDGELKEVDQNALSEFYKKSTIRIDQPKKSDTQRILNETQRIKEDTQKIKDDTQKLKDSTQKIKEETQKIMAETRRIDDATKQTTMRVEVSEEQKKKKDTTRLPPVSDLSKRSTAKIDVGEMMEGETEDVFKRKTIPVGVPTPPPQQQRPPSAGHIRPKTAQFKPPPGMNETIGMAPPVSAASTSDAKKSETARIDLPPEAEERPITRPKTIRIKRPDGTTARKQLTIARPADADAGVVSSASLGDEEDVGAGVSLCALAAVVVAAILVYVLMAQTIASSLPFPGRI